VTKKKNLGWIRWKTLVLSIGIATFPIIVFANSDKFTMLMRILKYHHDGLCQNSESTINYHEPTKKISLSEKCLIWAVEEGSKEIVELLLANNVDVYVQDSRGNTPLDLAEVNKKEIVKLLIIKGIMQNIDGKGKNDSTLLHWAAILDSKEIVELLIAKGLNVNARTKKGKTPLFWAIEEGQEEIAELLIARGADVNTITKDGSSNTPLHLAARKASSKITELLIVNGADVNAQDKDGFTPLHWAAASHRDLKGEERTIINDRRKKIVELLIIHGADVNAQAQNVFTPLHSAASEEIEKLLIVNGADVIITQKREAIWLYWAIMKGNREKVEMLISQGLDINAQINGKPPLHWAVSTYRKEMVELLIALGADVNARDENNLTPLHEIATTDFFGATKITKEIGELLIAQGADVNARTKTTHVGNKITNNETPLHYAAKHNLNKLVELLLANNADVNAKTGDGDTPLHMAVFPIRLFVLEKARDIKETVEVLIAGGADVNARNNSGWTPLHCVVEWAAVNSLGSTRKGWLEIVKEIIELLIAEGADVNAWAEPGWTPLHSAKEGSLYEIADLLIAKGANKYRLKESVKGGIGGKWDQFYNCNIDIRPTE